MPNPLEIPHPLCSFYEHRWARTEAGRGTLICARCFFFATEEQVLQMQKAIEVSRASAPVISPDFTVAEKRVFETL